MAHHDGVRAQIPALEAGVAAAQVDNLDIAEADPAGIDAHQQLAGARSRDVAPQRGIFVPQVLQAGAVQFPAEHLVGHGLRAVIRIDRGSGRHRRLLSAGDAALAILLIRTGVDPAHVLL